MRVNIKEFHTKTYEFLKELRETHSDLRYTYRKSNYGGRLEDGYWFYGTDDYFCISFWSGMDWKNRTPNISFFFLANGSALLEINVSDSDKKREFVEKYIVDELQLSFEGKRYVKYYGIDEYEGLSFLNLFINGFDGQISDKVRIDKIISSFSNSFFENDDNGIGFIKPSEFRSRDLKINKYIELQDLDKKELHDALSKPTKLHSIKIENYNDIVCAQIEDIPHSTQWIFLTGENGSGKTSILKAIATGLGYRILNKKELTENTDFRISLKFHKGKDLTSYYRILNEGCAKRFPLVSALALFGPNRLISNKDKLLPKDLSSALTKEGLFKPLWEFDYRMLEIEEQLDVWRKEKSNNSKTELEKRIYYIKTLLSKVVPGLYDIRFEKIEKKGNVVEIETKYVFRKDEVSLEEEKCWQQLPSGTRSVFAMVSEMLVRLYHYQKEIIDPAELRGIVIIDEIDLHLHPIAQRQIIIDLSEAFSNVQFIIATHSPIPLLGAPIGSVFVKITKDANDGIVMERLINIEKNIGNLLPNTLYTSSVFGMNDMTSVANKNKEDVFTQDNNNEALEYIQLKEKFQVSKISDKYFVDKLKQKLKIEKGK